VDPGFTEFVALLVDEYSTIGYTDTECGYACSDHVSRLFVRNSALACPPLGVETRRLTLLESSPHGCVCVCVCPTQASWSKIGAPSAFAIESTFANSNKNIHSSSDTMDQTGYSLDHIREVSSTRRAECGSDAHENPPRPPPLFSATRDVVAVHEAVTLDGDRNERWRVARVGVSNEAWSTSVVS
jgi:hypothetical protein